jgi:hypothetical protein
MPVVLVAPQATACAECERLLAAGDLLHEEAGKPLCLDCALFGDLELLPSGDVALTRRATSYSRKRAVVLEWSRRRRRFERRGTLVEPAARRRAAVDGEADATVRAHQRVLAAARREVEDRAFVDAFAAAVLALFPGCPRAEAREIAGHACAKHSGRVGRTAAAKELETEAVRLAVIAHVRHTHTDYDRIITRTRDKRGSRSRIREGVDDVLRRWARPVAPAAGDAGATGPGSE